MGASGELPVTEPRGEGAGLGAVAPGEERIVFTVPVALSGERIDKVIAACVEALSRGQARKLLGLGAVFVGRRRCRVASRGVSAGEQITVTWRDRVQEATTYPLEVVYEDEHLAVIDKPAGQHTQGTALGDAGTVVRVAARHFGPHARIAHRLDAPTSGLLLIGKTSEAVNRLRPLIEGHVVERHYLALCATPPPEGLCDRALVREGRLTRVAAPGQGRDARTWFEILERREGVALVHARLETGRTHQVRVHLLSLDAPIVGDRTYGGLEATRLALHAWRLALDHPFTGARVDVRREPGEDFWKAAHWSAVDLGR